MTYLLRLCGSAALLLLLTLAAGVCAQAQTTTLTSGWEDRGEFFSDPISACRAQWTKSGMDNGWSRFIGAKDVPSSYVTKECEWTSVQYLCPEETGGGVANCGTVLPGTVSLNCGSARRSVLPGSCVITDEAVPERSDQCSASDNKSVNPSVGNPILISTGAKLYSETDYQTVDQLVSIRRLYRSNPVGRSYSAFAPSSGLAGGWAFDFAYELQIDRILGSSSSPSVYLALVNPDGTAYDYKMGSGNVISPNTVDVASVYAGTQYRLEFLGPMPTNIGDLDDVSTEWRFTDDDGTVWTLKTFQSPVTGKFLTAKPIKKLTRGGYAWTFSYGSSGELNSITDDRGRTLNFTWSRYYKSSLQSVPSYAEAVKRIDLPDGSYLVYSYDPPAVTAGPSLSTLQRLVKAQRFSAANAVIDSHSYHYESTVHPRKLTGVTDNRGIRIATYAYDAEGRAVSTEGANGSNRYTVEYGVYNNGLTRRVVNPLGRSSTYRFQRFSTTALNDIRLVSVEGDASANCPDSIESVGYASNGFVASIVDEKGVSRTTTRDARGRPTTIVEAAGTADARTTQIVWHPTFNQPTQMARPGLTIDLTYNALGQIATRTLTDTTTITAPYSTGGRTRTWSYSWSSTGLLQSEDGPLPGNSDTTTYSYNASGQLTSMTDPLGHVTQVTSRDASGAPLTVVDPNGTQTQFAYDLMGRLVTITTNPGSSQSQYALTYDAAGNVTKLTLPRGGWLEVTYDGASRVTAVKNSRNERIDYELNPVGESVRSTTRNPASSITKDQRQAYDELGRLIRLTGANAQNVLFGYDKVGSLVSATDAESESWSYTFDRLRRVLKETDPEAVETAYAYAPSDALSSLEDGRDLTTNRVVDGFGLTIRETSPDRGTLTYWYDQRDLLVKSQDADGVVHNYAYDANGRLLSETFSAASWENITYSYDNTAGGNKGIGRLTGVSDASGSHAYVYDAQGRVTYDTQVIGGQLYVVSYAYDANGDLASVTYPSGHIVNYARDNTGVTTSITAKASASSTAVSLVSNVTYMPFGPLSGMTFGNGLTTTRQFDQNYWLSGLTLGATGANRLNLAFSRDLNGRLTGVTDNLATGRAAAFGYTEAGRIQYGVGPWGVNSYSYDDAGNRVEVRTEVGNTASYEFALTPASNNRITEVRDTNWALKRQLAYRAGGDLSTQTFVGGATFEYLYGAHKRVLGVKKNGADLSAYRYDYTGRRVSAQMLGSAPSLTHYVFAIDGHLLAEYNANTGSMTREYAWFDDMPVAILTGTGTTLTRLYIHTGQIGEPLMMTDASKAAVWSAAFDPWGQPAMLPPTATSPLLMRLPGQWQQSETGLYQNWMRDYDPTLGRYVQGDPIGLLGGTNLYAYANGDPLQLIDPNGENPLVIGVLAGALIGSSGNLAWQLYKHGGDFDCVNPWEVLRWGLEGALTGATLRPLGLTGEAARLYNANKVHHIFGFTKHGMQPLVTRYGSKEAAMTALHSAAQGVSSSAFSAGTRISVGGHSVWVRGVTVNGVNRIGSASIL